MDCQLLSLVILWTAFVRRRQKKINSLKDSKGYRKDFFPAFRLELHVSFYKVSECVCIMQFDVFPILFFPS